MELFCWKWRQRSSDCKVFEVMAHFAEIDSSGVVLRVLVVPDEQEQRGEDFLSSDLELGGTWVQTSYNTRAGNHINGGIPLRKNFAGIGFTYDFDRDAFIPPKPYPSWLLEESTCSWIPPIDYPDDGLFYLWNESLLSWVPAGD